MVVLLFIADANAPDNNGSTPVALAAHRGHVDAIKALVDVGANVHTPDNDGDTPLLIAAHQGQKKVIKLLWKLGADMAPTTSEYTALNLAEVGNHAEAANYIQKVFSKMTSECEFCGCSTKRLKICSVCEKSYYCSRDCQVKDYKKHKKECIPSSQINNAKMTDDHFPPVHK
jgi:hypothetical protein